MNHPSRTTSLTVALIAAASAAVADEPADGGMTAPVVETSLSRAKRCDRLTDRKEARRCHAQLREDLRLVLEHRSAVEAILKELEGAEGAMERALAQRRGGEERCESVRGSTLSRLMEADLGASQIAMESGRLPFLAEWRQARAYADEQVSARRAAIRGVSCVKPVAATRTGTRGK